MSFTLAMLCAVILSFALLRVWRRQERVEQVRRETTAALAHELKTPLSVLSAAAELLGDNLAPEKQAHYLDVIQTQAQRMDGSVRKMLELSRLETGVQALRREEFPLAPLAQERLAAALPADGRLRSEFATDNGYTVSADRALLASRSASRTVCFLLPTPATPSRIMPCPGCGRHIIRLTPRAAQRATVSVSR